MLLLRVNHFFCDLNFLIWVYPNGQSKTRILFNVLEEEYIIFNFSRYFDLGMSEICLKNRVLQKKRK